MKGKILFTASTCSHILQFHLPYLQGFQERGWSVHVAAGGPCSDIPFADETIDLPLEKSMTSLKNFKAAMLLRKKIRQEGYTLICTHTTLAAFFTRLALQGLKERPLVADMVHGYLFDGRTPYLKRKLLLAAERWMAPVTDLLLTMNRWDYDLARRYQLGKQVVHVPGAGVDFSRFERTGPGSRCELRRENGISDDAFVLIYAAEFSKRKSQAVLIRAMKLLPGEVVLILPGDGALRRSCQELARRLGVDDRVFFPGHVSEMAPWYAIADAAVSSSRSEGLPFNIMEAMYMGLPVIASDVKGHRDLIEHEVTGLLYPYADEYACAAQITHLLESSGLWRDIVRQAQAQVARNGLDRVFPIVMAQYAALLPEGSGGFPSNGKKKPRNQRGINYRDTKLTGIT